jgi:SAM-dependent methyltransferase
MVEDSGRSATTDPVEPAHEIAAVRERYARRQGDDRRYSLLRPAVLIATHERQRALADLLVDVGLSDLSAVRLLEVGCGSGSNLLELLRFGFAPEHLRGIELLPASFERARHSLPQATHLTLGDATGEAGAEVADESQDVVYQSTVFSSLLDDAFQQRLADRMWRWLRPGGAILWYDFIFDNPRNPDVRGVPVRRIRELFPYGSVRVRRVTLAPPLARLVTKVHPALYQAFNTCVPLRTHVLAWVAKP